MLYFPMLKIPSILPSIAFSPTCENFKSAPSNAPISSHIPVTPWLCFLCVPSPTVVVSTAATATPSGNGRSVLIISALLSDTIHSTPSIPPSAATIVVSM